MQNYWVKGDWWTIHIASVSQWIVGLDYHEEQPAADFKDDSHVIKWCSVD